MLFWCLIEMEHLIECVFFFFFVNDRMWFFTRKLKTKINESGIFVFVSYSFIFFNLTVLKVKVEEFLFHLCLSNL